MKDAYSWRPGSVIYAFRPRWTVFSTPTMDVLVSSVYGLLIQVAMHFIDLF
jgi:hypothetical protein